LLALCALIPTIPVSSFATGADDGTTVTSKVYVDNKLNLKQNKLPYDATANLIIAQTTDGGEATKRAITTAGAGITGLTNNSADTDKQKIPTAYAVKEAIGNIDVNTNTVNGAPLSNAASYYYGESSTAAGTAAKEVTISSITSLNAGQIIAVKTTNASTVANNTLTLKKDNETSFGAKPILYRGAALTTETAPLVWTAGGVSFFVYDGTSWNFAGGGADNTNSTYTADESTLQLNGTQFSAKTAAVAGTMIVMSVLRFIRIYWSAIICASWLFFPCMVRPTGALIKVGSHTTYFRFL
jgi:hypothetical protein